MLGVHNATVIESLEAESDEEGNCVVAHVRPRRLTKRWFGLCGARSSNYDNGEGRRR